MLNDIGKRFMPRSSSIIEHEFRSRGRPSPPSLSVHFYCIAILVALFDRAVMPHPAPPLRPDGMRACSLGLSFFFSSPGQVKKTFLVLFIFHSSFFIVYFFLCIFFYLALFSRAIGHGRLARERRLVNARRRAFSTRVNKTQWHLSEFLRRHRERFFANPPGRL